MPDGVTDAFSNELSNCVAYCVADSLADELSNAISYDVSNCVAYGVTDIESISSAHKLSNCGAVRGSYRGTVARSDGCPYCCSDFLLLELHTRADRYLRHGSRTPWDVRLHGQHVRHCKVRVQWRELDVLRRSLWNMHYITNTSSNDVSDHSSVRHADVGSNRSAHGGSHGIAV